MIPGATPTKGRLLVATPALADLNFRRTVVYVLEHHAEGAVGVVLNRPSGIQLHDPLDRWHDLESSPSGLYNGGPVETDALIAVGLADANIDAATDQYSPILGRIASVDLTADPTLAAATITRLRVFRGYAGWGTGQVESEIDEGAWIVLDAADEDLFTERPSELWRSVLRRQPGRLAWLADAPDDLSLN